MDIKIFLISACVAVSANAVWDWNGNDNNPSSRIRRMQADSYSQFDSMPDFSDFPDMPNFDNFPVIKIPKIEIPKIEIPKIEMREMKIPQMEIPEMKFPDIKMSPEDIALLHKGRGVSMVTINGETVVTINVDGNLETFRVPAGSSKEKTSAILAEAVVKN